MPSRFATWANPRRRDYSVGIRRYFLRRMLSTNGTANVKQQPRPVLCIVGPTGSGKSHLALQLAQRLQGEIINCDSLQIYRGFDIGTAKPSALERTAVPHHLIDVVNSNEVYTAGDFARQARETLLTISDRRKLPIVAGGTGFYLKALVDGLVDAPKRDDELRQRLEQMETRRPGILYRLLLRWDPASAKRISALDRQKLVRAVELMLLEKRPLSEIYQDPRRANLDFSFFQIGVDPPRSHLYQRLNDRCDRMLEAGLLDEVQALLASGVSPDDKAFGSIGYKQALDVLRGTMDVPAAMEEMKRDTRRYAKRQWTWFRRDSRVFWIRGFGDSPQSCAQALRAIHNRFFWY